MANTIPPWFIEAFQKGTVDNKPIPPWFPKNDSEPIDTSVGNTTGSTTYNSANWPTVTVKGAYRNDQVNTNLSYYFTPIVKRPLQGRSRRAGDAPPEVIDTVRNMLIESGRSKGLNNEDLAMVFAIAHHESGFNPDAAAGPSSASGVGQFINETGARYKLTRENRWDTEAQVRALVEHYLDNKKLLKEGEGIEYIYAYHHDGAGRRKNAMGLGISRRDIMPLYKQYLSVFERDNTILDSLE